MIDFNDIADPVDNRDAGLNTERDEIRSELIARMESVLTTMFPAGKKRQGKFLIGDVLGSPGDSLEVVLTGEKAGLWTDRATGDGGDIFDLLAAYLGASIHADFPRVLQEASDLLGRVRSAPVRKTKAAPPSDDLGPATAKWDYFDATGKLIAVVFRFVVRLRNTLDFAVGVIVQAAGWQSWVILQPGESRHLAGGISVSGMANSDAYPLHPQSPYYGWQGSWGNGGVSMNDGQASVSFGLFLTAPTPPETTPANLPALKATQRWTWDPAQISSDGRPQWAAIKRCAADGTYDYEHAFEPYASVAGEIRTLRRSITKPTYQALIDPGSYFVSGYDTSPYDWSSAWHKRPWPRFSGWSALTVPIMCRGEKQSWDGSKYVWVPVDEVSISLSRDMVQQVAARLGVAEHVVMDGDDIRWFAPGASGSWHNVLWIDRFYTRSGALVGDAAMRAAFQSVIDEHADTWIGYRNLVVHSSVRFGSFLDNGGFEVGEYILGPQGDMVEASSLDDLYAVSTRFMYSIQPGFQ